VHAGLSWWCERERRLRRDELALLAGISTEYYTRLEQGSDHHPSAQVLDSIARALRLDADATGHLHELAAPATARRRRARRPEQVAPSVRQLLDSWPTNPAFVQGRFLDVLAANPLMTALSPMYTPGRNLLRAAFLDSAVSELFCDPDVRLENVVSALRASVGPDADDPQLTALIGELELHYDKFHLAGADRQMLTIYQAQAGSRSEQALTLLATIAADQQHPSGLAHDIDAGSDATS
jgi:transcriptional regulator with XRE-family HTH domain